MATAAQIADWKLLGPLHQAKAAYHENTIAADESDALFQSWLSPAADLEQIALPSRYRIAARIEGGRSVENAAAREYLYRWNLALQSPVFGVPHSLGF